MIGQTLGHYRIQDKLGAGGMGVVYRAYDTRLERTVAIKVVGERMGASDKAHERLLREARLASSLNHPHICTIHEVGEAEGQVYCVMEYVDGRRLRDVVPTDGLPAQTVIRYGIQIADALAKAHERGVIHRDLKTANVMVTPDGRIKVLDFGLAKRLQSEELADETTRSGTAATAARDSSLTGTGQVVGTLHYLAPEVLRGKTADERTDLWALGVLLYETASGDVPFKGGTDFEATAAILSQAPRPLPARLPPALQSIVVRCLAKDPAERYQQANEVRAALEAVQSGTTATVAVVEPRAIPRRWVLAGAAVAAALLALGAWRLLRQAPAAESVAVLPFQNVAGNADTEFLSDGIPESVIASLSRLPGLKVIAFGSVVRYKGRALDARQVVKELGVAAIVTGRVVQRPDGLVVSAELVSGKDLSRLWGDQYSEKVTDLLSIQDDLAQKISAQLRPRLTRDEQRDVARRYTDDTEAYKLYLKGRYYWYKFTPEGYQKSLGLYREAIDRDPSYALAYAGMAATYASMAIEGLTPPSEGMPLARAAALKAIEIDDRLGEAHGTLADIKTAGYWDFEGGQAEWRRALELSPNNAVIRRFHAQALRIFKRWDEAVVEMNRALELDPLSPETQKTLGAILEWAGRYDAAIAQYKTTLELDPKATDPHAYLADAYARRGLEKESIAERQLFLKGIGDEETASALARDYAQLGYREAMGRLWRQTLAGYQERAKTDYVSPMAFAYVYAALDDNPHALDWLEKAVTERTPWAVYLDVDPQFAGLRSEPRFADLVRRIGLPS